MLCWILIFQFVLIAVTLFLVLLVELWIIIGSLVPDMGSIVSVWIICAEIFALLYRYNLTVRCYHDFQFKFIVVAFYNIALLSSLSLSSDIMVLTFLLNVLCVPYQRILIQNLIQPKWIWSDAICVFIDLAIVYINDNHIVVDSWLIDGELKFIFVVAHTFLFVFLNTLNYCVIFPASWNVVAFL